MRPVLILFISALALVASDDDKEPLGGSRKDNCGNIEWRSTATKGKKQWDYVRTVTNREKGTHCAVTWKNGTSEWSMVVPDDEPAEAVDRGRDDPPEEVKGTISYRGGQAAKEGSAQAPAWHPKGAVTKSLSESSSVTLNFVWNEKLYRLRAASLSSAIKEGDDFKAVYNVKLMFKDAKSLPEGVYMRWTSLAKVRDKDFPVLEGGRLVLDKSNEFKANLRSASLYRSDGFLEVIAGDDGKVLSRAWMPSFVPERK